MLYFQTNRFILIIIVINKSYKKLQNLANNAVQMGNTQNKDKIGIQHPKLKDAVITNSKKIVLDYKIPENYAQWTKKYQAIQKLNTSNSLFLPKIQQTQRQNFCGSEKEIKLIFDMFPFTLDQEISKRHNMNEKFTQQQLWYLLYQLLLASSIFQKKRQKSGDIRPRNILINEQGVVNVINIASFPDQITNYYKSLLLKIPTFLAPQQLAELQNKMKYCKSDPVVAQSFSIGLTIIDAALLFDSEQLYDVKNISFNNSMYNQNLVAFKSMNLSPFFIKTVLNLLEVKGFDRPSPGQTLAILKPYQLEILELQQFAPDRERSKTSLQDFQHSIK